MKGPSEKGHQFAVLEYMKGGQMAHPCAPCPSSSSGPRLPPPSRTHHRYLRVSKPNICRLQILHCLCQHGCEPEIFMFPRLSCVCMLLEMWVEVKVHSYYARAHVCRQLYVLRASHALVQATVGVGTVLIVYLGVANTGGGGGGYIVFS